MDRVQARPTSCCTPSRGGATAPAPAATAHTGGHETDMALLPGGTFLMGAEDADGFPTDGEGPVREVAVAAFRIDVHAVTNERFARFVRETGHVTEAERFGWSYAFAGFLPAAPRPEGTPWWCGVEGAS
ncbi:SUMF1/EgtB/PvdO family nonheme iron enzyme [Streptomyces violaceusniger]